MSQRSLNLFGGQRVHYFGSNFKGEISFEALSRECGELEHITRSPSYEIWMPTSCVSLLWAGNESGALHTSYYLTLPQSQRKGKETNCKLDIDILNMYCGVSLPLGSDHGSMIHMTEDK